ncbi:MULE domain-containing protein, partial [Aphis craccivora]
DSGNLLFGFYVSLYRIFELLQCTYSSVITSLLSIDYTYSNLTYYLFYNYILQIIKIMPLQFIKSQRGHDLLIHDGFIHKRESLERGCFFHLSQAVWRQIQHHGLAKQYSDDVQFSLEVRKLAALAFLPFDKVIEFESFELLLDSTYYIENEEMLSPLITYFEGTWIGILDRRGNRRPPLFPIEIWNCYDRLQESY